MVEIGNNRQNFFCDLPAPGRSAIIGLKRAAGIQAFSNVLLCINFPRFKEESVPSWPEL